MTHDELHELAAPYALDALSADERGRFEAHLSDCERCRAELAELSETAASLAYAAEGPVPPAELRGRILARARDDPPNVVALRPRRTRLYVGAALAAAACAALAIGLSLGLSGGGTTTRYALKGATGSVALRSSGKATLTVSDLAAAPAGKAYEIWVLASGVVVPAGLFHGGPGTSVVRLTKQVEKGAVVAVTLEPAAGSKVPTSRVLFAARLSA
jgi:anti-sigma-K factor RskA